MLFHRFIVFQNEKKKWKGTLETVHTMSGYDANVLLPTSKEEIFWQIKFSHCYINYDFRHYLARVQTLFHTYKCDFTDIQTARNS